MDEDDFEFELDEDEQARVRLRQERDADAWKWIMADVRGRRAVRMLMRASAVHTRGGSDPQLLALREGERRSGILIIELVREHAPEHFTTLFEDDKDD